MRLAQTSPPQGGDELHHWEKLLRLDFETQRMVLEMPDVKVRTDG